MSEYLDGVNVTRREYDKLRVKIDRVETLLKETRVTLQGEQGTNGMKSSLDRAHSAIHGLTLRVGELGSLIHDLSMSSLQGDKDVEIMVLKKLEAMQAHDYDQEKKDRKWRIGQAIGISLALLALAANIGMQLWS